MKYYLHCLINYSLSPHLSKQIIFCDNLKNDSRTLRRRNHFLLRLLYLFSISQMRLFSYVFKHIFLLLLPSNMKWSMYSKGHTDVTQSWFQAAFNKNNISLNVRNCFNSLNNLKVFYNKYYSVIGNCKSFITILLIIDYLATPNISSIKAAHLLRHNSIARTDFVRAWNFLDRHLWREIWNNCNSTLSDNRWVLRYRNKYNTSKKFSL